MRCYFITDANNRIGMGHVVRCTTLAGALKKRGLDCSFLLSSSPSFVVEWIEKRGHSVHQISGDIRDSAVSLSNWLNDQEAGDQFLIYDSDHEEFYDVKYQQHLRQAGKGVMFIVFHNPSQFDVDILHNQNPLSLETQYQINDSAKQLLGLEYVILKPEYNRLALAAEHKQCGTINTVLLTFGGADEHNLSARALKILDQLQAKPKLTVHLVIGGLNPRRDELQTLAESNFHEVKVWIDTDQMPQLMFESDLAISSGGITVWELACCKTMNLILPTSEREELTANKLSQDGLVHLLGKHNQVSDANVAEALNKYLLGLSHHQQKVEDFFALVNPGGADLVAKFIFDWNRNLN